MGINRYSLRKAMPAILTGLACIGVVATGIMSARAGARVTKRFSEEVIPTKKEKVKIIVKEAAIPTVIGAGTIASFIFARQADKKVIAGLSAAVADLSTNVVDETSSQLYMDREGDIKPDVILDDDGELYYEPTTDIFIKAKHETIMEAFYKVNRNYQLRGGVASLYELFRMMGITKKKINELGLQWSEYVGWHGGWAEQYGYNWVDFYTEGMEDDKGEVFSEIILPFPPMPICVDPPKKTGKKHKDN